MDGQVIVSLPGYTCLRCFFLTDALLEWSATTIHRDTTTTPMRQGNHRSCP